MRDLSAIANQQAQRLASGQPAKPDGTKVANDVFKAMHGAYGKQFLDKFATGKLDANGHDEGIKSARMAWAHALKRFDVEVIAEALERMRRVHPVWPPALGEFERLCIEDAGPAIASARDVAEQLKALPCDGKAFASATKAARDAAMAKIRGASQAAAPAAGPDGMTLLKQAIASAVGAAGGDEAAELLRLDRALSPRKAAA